MLLDSEPEAEPATAKRLALGGFWRRCYTGEYDGEVLWRIAPEFLTVGFLWAVPPTGSVKCGGQILLRLQIRRLKAQIHEKQRKIAQRK